VAYLLLDTEPDPPERPRPPLPPNEPALARSLVPRPPQSIVNVAAAGARVARAGAHAALHPHEALDRSRALGELIIRDEVIGAPHTSLNVPIGSTRRFAVVNRPLADLKAIRRRLGGSINDVVLAACTSGLRQLLLARGEQLPRRGLRAMVPMNVRQESERLLLGNRISSLFVDLPIATEGAHERHKRIAAATAHLKTSNAASGAEAMLDLAALAPPVVHATLARSLYATRLFNVTITNVPGPQVPLYAFGALLREVHPVVPLAASHAIGIAIFSYNGLVTFGVIADRDSTPDIGVLSRGIEQGIDELLRLVVNADRLDTIEQART
jgi:WS/DGAT/MGAT family acyltransferase